VAARVPSLLPKPGWCRLRKNFGRAGPRQAGNEARTDGIGDAREHGAAAAELAFPVNKILISAAIEGRGAQAMIVLVLRQRLGRIRAAHPHPGGNRRWTC